MRKGADPDVQRFDRWATKYERSLMQKLLFMPVHARMLDHLSAEKEAAPPAFLVDVGCGTGRFLRTAGARWPTARMTGVDPAWQMVREAQRLNPDVTFLVASAEALPFPDRAADLVATSMSFHHWADQRKGIREIARVLNPGGVFCLADHVVPLFRRKKILGLLTEAGFSVRTQTSVMLFLLVIVARKL